ncbi:MAG: hypothetical protein Q4P15_11500 [Propionibacteriaceae bacterium]|nr:hypothetical protein [Propionibacteriaceae bacterium]
MIMPTRRRFGTTIAALALVVGLASGCTAGDWRYDAPPAAGVQQDAGPLKARNVMVLADGEGEGLLLGSVFTTQAVELTEVGVAAEQQDGSFAEPVLVKAEGDVPVNGSLLFGGKESRIEGADLQEGLLANVFMRFSDGTTMEVEAPVMSSTHSDYAEAWDKAQG